MTQTRALNSPSSGNLQCKSRLSVTLSFPLFLHSSTSPPLFYQPASMVSGDTPKAAWVIVLTSTNDYVKGVVTIAHALRRVNSIYPLVVLYTDAVTESVKQRLKQSGCILKHIEPIRPHGKVTYFTERFTETWTKLAVWGQDEYERLVLLDADMLPLQNMDELMTMPLPDSDSVAACHACTCNPQKIKAYPSNW